MRRPLLLVLLVAAPASAAGLYALSKQTPAPAPEVKATTAAGVQDTGRWRYQAGGFSLLLPAPLQPRTVNAGVNRILRVQLAGKPLVVFNSGPVYPWMRREDLSRDRWHTGEVKLAGSLRIPFSGDWAFRPGDDPRLLLLAYGRLVTVSTPRPEQWGDPAVQAIIASFQPLPGADLRAAYRRLGRDGGDPRMLRTGIARSLAAIASAQLPLVARKGIAAHRAGQLDALDSWILLDLLQPTVRREARARRAKAKPARACPVGPPK